jgi:hypothetical protein
MITTTITMAVLAALFVLFGLMQRGQERRSCSGGNCTSCSNPNECEIGAEGRLP